MAQTAFDLSDLRAGVQRLKAATSKDLLVNDLWFIAEEIIDHAKAAPIPEDTRSLASSSRIERRKGKGEVIFGFNKRYAAFQDAPGRSGSYTIRPKRKKMLYIPLTRRGRNLHQYGANPADEGLIRGVDYVLARQAVIPIKSYGSKTGPNHYFSGTIEKDKEWAFQEFAWRVERRIARSLKRIGNAGRT